MDPRIERAILEHRSVAETLAWQYVVKLNANADRDEIFGLAAEALCQAGSRWLDYCAARGYHPWDPAFPDRPEKHFTGYCVKRIRGALMDFGRREDHCTRSVRARLKSIKAAQADGAHGELGIAAATRIPAEKIRAALAADELRPVSTDWTLPGTEHAGLADGSADADVAGTVEFNAAMAAFLAAYDGLSTDQQVVLALRYHAEVSLEVAAKELKVSEEAARELHDSAVRSVHRALLLAVAA